MPSLVLLLQTSVLKQCQLLSLVKADPPREAQSRADNPAKHCQKRNSSFASRTRWQHLKGAADSSNSSMWDRQCLKAVAAVLLLGFAAAQDAQSDGKPYLLYL